MAKKTAALLPATAQLLEQFGERLRLARLRRRLTARQVAERAGMAPMTLRGLERGGPGVTMGAYLGVMQVLGIENDLNLLGKADPVGRDLQDAQLPSNAKTSSPRLPPTRPSVSNTKKATPRQPPAAMSDWIKKGGFTDPSTLAGLIILPRPPKPPKKKVR